MVIWSKKEKDQGNQPGHTGREHHPETQLLLVLVESPEEPHQGRIYDQE